MPIFLYKQMELVYDVGPIRLKPLGIPSHFVCEQGNSLFFGGWSMWIKCVSFIVRCELMETLHATKVVPYIPYCLSNLLFEGLREKNCRKIYFRKNIVEACSSFYLFGWYIAF